MRRTTLAICLLMAVISAGCTKAPPTTVADQLPPIGLLCQQIHDHIAAYTTWTGCPQAQFGGKMGFFPSVAESGHRAETCTPANDVHLLPYNSPRVDQAVRTVMQRELQGELDLYHSIRVISIVSLDYASRPDDTEEDRQQLQGELRELVFSVPWLIDSLTEQILTELGSDQVCAPDPERRNAVDISRLPEILTTMNMPNPNATCAGTAHGIFAVGGVDPILAVAIARMQHRSLGRVPSMESIIRELGRMEVTVEPAAEEPSDEEEISF